MSLSLSDRFRDFFTVRIDRKNFLMLFVSILGFFVWFLAFPLFGPIMSHYLDGMRLLTIERGRVMQIFLLAMMVSSFVSGYIIDKLVRRVVFIWVSTLLASVLTCTFLVINDILLLFPASLILGLVSGVFPVALGAFFADNSSPEDRGRIMGVSIALSMPISYSFLILQQSTINITSDLEFLIIGSIFIITLLTIFLKPQEKSDEIKNARRRGGAGIKQTIFYAVPVFLFFAVVGVLLSIVFPTIQDNVSSGIFYVTWGLPFVLGAIVGGVLLDSYGRKLPMIIGLAITGVSLAVLALIGLRNGFISILTLSFGFAIVTVSSFIIWADLAPINSRGLHYGLGFGLIAGAMALGLMGVGNIFGSVRVQDINRFMLYSSVALFLCIPPLIQAEDALPREIIERRQMEEHLRRARRQLDKK
jgi:MFS family permease